MPVVVHHRNGQNQEVLLANSCSWSTGAARKNGSDAAPRWLVCRNDRGDVVATYEEAEIIGYKVTPAKKKARFRFPRILNRVTTRK